MFSGAYSRRKVIDVAVAIVVVVFTRSIEGVSVELFVGNAGKGERTSQLISTEDGALVGLSVGR